MAVILQITYSKKLGLPNFSSHSCSVSIQSEIPDLSQITGEVKRLYALTQDAVDREIQEVGYMPDATTYGMLPSGEGSNGTSQSRASNAKADETPWACSPKQRDLLEKIVRENDLDKREVDDLAKEMFNGAGVRQLNRLQASGLIDELFERHGGQRRDRAGNGNAYRGRFQREQRGAAR